MRLPKDRNNQIDKEDGEYNVTPGAWRDHEVPQDIKHARRGALPTREERTQIILR